ncbi:MAG: hybrid sensor histidine kinase/response regulator [Candidatus Rokuibacteriota bacterium]|nr:MAG: hybrid sensor histidine kinase/response regulator [Candidatus Rokubacteria bacterium]
MKDLDANLIIANAPDPVFVSDLQGKILLANEAVSELLGLRKDEVLEQSLSRFVSRDEARELMGALHEVVERGVTRNVRLNPRSASGEVIATSLNASALREPSGEVIGVIGILRDMRALDKARAYAESLIKNAPDPVFVSDLHGKILQANDAVYSLLGFRTAEVVEQSLSRFISVDETREFMAALREVVARGVTRNARLTPRSASGEVIPTTLNASALRDPDGTVIGAIGILRDMRAYEMVVRELEESGRKLDDANRAKDEFLATLSHELRTPLSSILGWVRLLRSGTLDPAGARRGLEVIERNTRTLAQLIEDLLDVSRIITGKLRLEVRPINLASVIVAAMEAVQTAADAKGIRLEASLDPSMGPITADPDRLQQVVWNLLTNAIKFTTTSGRVDVRLEPADSLARITVSDTGKGIRSELLPFVFDRFRQGETSVSRRHGGLGLGLAIVRHIIELHGGIVRAESPGDGRGATFTVELPLIATSIGTVEAVAARRTFDSEPIVRPAALRGLRVLVVDDEADARELMRMILRSSGADVMAAGSADEAFEQVEQWHPDILVSDIGLPGDDGYALIQRLRSREAERGGSIPALALTAYARAEDKARALAAGFQVHLAKPLEPAEFVAAIANLVKKEGVATTAEAA